MTGVQTCALPISDSNGSPNIARYDNQITGLSVTIGTGTPYVATFAPTDNRLTIRNLPGFDDARLVANTPTSFAPVNGFTPTRFNITLADGTATAFNSQYPTSVPSISAFTTTNQWRLVFTGGRVVQGALSNITAVPLPAAVILFGAGLVALVGLGAGSWRKRRSDAAEMSS